MSDTRSGDAELIGAIIKGEAGVYKIVRAIGAGGMGSVYEAETVGTGRSVALKFLHQELSGEDSSSQDRFEREIRVLQDLKAFRGIVQIEDWGRHDDGRMYLVMEFVAAPTLDKIIDENPNGLPQIKAVQIAIEILSVLEPIHHRRFVHRDLKPHNICVYDEPLAIRLLDFGLSKPYMEGHGYEKVTRRMQGKGSEIPGSPHYMAVEQFLRPKEVDQRTDLYAVGVILYELIAGIPPFRGIYLQDILRQHKENEPPRIDQTVDGGGVSYRLWDVIEKSLAKNLESRYQTAAEFKEALFDVLNNLNKRRRPRKDLDSKYRILRKLGTGGNSEVFEVERRDDGERLALKIAREGASDWDEETLMNEADRALVHDNIVRVFEFGSFEGRPALAMELMEGGSVEDVMAKTRDEGLEESFFYRTMIDICRGLHHAHQKNIVHRDVKPGNMLRTSDGRTKVCDFGIAKRFEQQGDEVQGTKNTSLAKGTAQYISPEQCDLQGRVDLRADIYSLGVMMYEMLAGRLPFTDGILIMQHLQTDPPPLEVKGDYKNPDALCAIVEKAMKKAPDHRFQSMKELAQELVRVSKLEPQKKAHKPVVLKTIPEEMLQKMAQTVGMSGGTGIYNQPEKKSTALKVALAAAFVVVIGVVGYIIINPPPSPVVPKADPRAEMFNELEGFLRENDWSSLVAFDFGDIEVDDGDRKSLGDNVERKISGMVSDQVNGLAEARSRIADLAQAAQALDAIAPTNGKTEAVRSFCAALEAFVAPLEAASESGYTEWPTESVTALEQALNGLPADWTTERWRLLVESEEGRVRRQNAGFLVAKIESGDLDWGAYGPKMDAILATSPLAERRPILEAVRKWSSERTIGAKDMGALTAFLADGGPAMRAAGRADRERLWAGGESDLAKARIIARDGAPISSRGEAVVLGVLDALADQDFVGAVVSWITLGPDPSAWPKELQDSGLAALPSPPFDGLGRRLLESAIAAPGFRAFFAAKRDEIQDGGARNDFRETCDKGRTDALALVRIDWDAFDAAAKSAWNEAIAPFSQDPGDLWRLNYGDIAGRIRTSGDLAETFAALEKLEGFLKLEGADSYKLQVETAAIEALKRFATPEEGIARLGLATRFDGLLRDYAAILAPARTEAAAQAARLLVQRDYLSVDWRAGLPTQALNAAWAGLGEPCIKLGLECHPQLVYLRSKKFELRAEGAVLGWSGDDLRELQVETSPAAVIRRAADGSLEVHLKVSLGWGQAPATNLELVLPGPEEGSYDVTPPVVSAPEWTGPRNGRLDLAVTIEDAHLPADLGSLELGALQLSSLGAGSAGAQRFGRTFGAADLAVLKSADATLRVLDGFGNEASATIPAAEFRQHFGALVDDLAAQRARELAAQAPTSSSAQALQNFAGEIQRFGTSIEELNRTGLGKPGVVASRALDETADSGGRWAAGISKVDPGLESAFQDYRSALDGLARICGSDWSTARQRLETAWASAKTRGTGSTGGSTTSTTTTGGDTYKGDVSALGLDWIRLGQGRSAYWIASSEVSLAFVRQNAQSWWSTQSFKVKDDEPIAKLSPRSAEELVAALNGSVASGLGGSFGTSVVFDIPSEDEWMEAVGKALGGGRSGYASGDWSEERYTPRVGEVPTRIRDYKWEKHLQPVTAGIGKLGPFYFLSGNVSEIVRSDSGFRLKGGSFYDARSPNYRNRLEVQNGQDLRNSSDAQEMSGLRLVLRPR